MHLLAGWGGGVKIAVFVCFFSIFNYFFYGVNSKQCFENFTGYSAFICFYDKKEALFYAYGFQQGEKSKKYLRDSKINNILKSPKEKSFNFIINAITKGVA